MQNMHKRVISPFFGIFQAFFSQFMYLILDMMSILLYTMSYTQDISKEK
ncbi:MAG: hypothetical protein PWQ55_547 [Chloroflexota bacterium]|nr:hypothetical protein [Chloroflexota bacterium]